MQADGRQRLLEALGPHLAPTISRMGVIPMRSLAPTLGLKLKGDRNVPTILANAVQDAVPGAPQPYSTPPQMKKVLILLLTS